MGVAAGGDGEADDPLIVGPTEPGSDSNTPYRREVDA